MSKLVQFLLINTAGGFCVGLAAGCAFIASGSVAPSLDQSLLASVLVLWGFGSSFALGAVATGLALLPYD